MVSSGDRENLDLDGAGSAFPCFCPSNANNLSDALVSGGGSRRTSIAPQAKLGGACLLCTSMLDSSWLHGILLHWRNHIETWVSQEEPRQSGNIVPGVFTPVLAKRSKPNRCHWPYRQPTGSNRSHDFGEQRIKTRSKLGWGRDEFPGRRLCRPTSTEYRRENSVFIQRDRRCTQSAGRSFGYARGLRSQGRRSQN
jgi:hypothetical protein